jgi:hypothetical protein
MTLRPFGLLVLLGAVGCAPALSSFTPAHVAKKGHVQAELGTDISIPTGAVGDIIDAGKAIASAAEKRELTESEKQTLYKTGLSLSLNPPSAVEHIGVAYAPIDRFEIGLRYAVNSLRLGTRYQFLTREKHGVDMSAGLGAGLFLFEFPVSDVIGIIEIEDFTRFQLDMPIQFGVSGNWYRVWGGPRLMFTAYGTEITFDPPDVSGVTPGEVEVASLDGYGFYVGAQGGVAFGYKYLFLGFELTLVEYLSNANMQVLGKTLADANMNSFIIYPGIALMGEF